MNRLPALLIAVLLAASSAVAMDIRREDRFVVRADQTVSNELWLAADKIVIKGTARDDVFMAGGLISLGGEFQNDVWAIGEVVDFHGKAAEHVRLMGRAVEVGGTADGSLVAAGNSVKVAESAEIQGDALLAGENVLTEGRIDGNIRVIATSVTLSGKFGGNVRVISDDIVVVPGTQIKGNLAYTASKELVLDSRVTLGGQLIRKDVEAFEGRPATASWNEVVFTQTFLYLCALVVGLPFVGLFPQFAGRAIRHLRSAGWKCALVGAAAFGLMPLLGFFVMLTLIGIPLGLLLLTVYVILLYLSKIVVALVIGGGLLQRRGPQPFIRIFTAMSLGLMVIYAVTALPVAGRILALAVVLTGLGAMMLALFAAEPAAAVSYATPPELPHPPSNPPPLNPEHPTKE